MKIKLHIPTQQYGFIEIEEEYEEKENLKGLQKLLKIYNYLSEQPVKWTDRINNYEQLSKKKLKPEILTHPNIPKPLHGIAPRTIEGQVWWNKTREEVYKSNDYCCIACGVQKTEAKGKKWLEAHEFWEIDYKTATATISSIEPLCHYCHNFIHSGRLQAILGIEKNEEEVKSILSHGFKILEKNKLQCFPGTLELAKSLGIKTKVKAYKITDETEWGDWKLLWNGKEYKSNFKNYKEWEEFYSQKNNYMNKEL